MSYRKVKVSYNLSETNKQILDSFKDEFNNTSDLVNKLLTFNNESLKLYTKLLCKHQNLDNGITIDNNNFYCTNKEEDLRKVNSMNDILNSYSPLTKALLDEAVSKLGGEELFQLKLMEIVKNATLQDVSVDAETLGEDESLDNQSPPTPTIDECLKQIEEEEAEKQKTKSPSL